MHLDGPAERLLVDDKDEDVGNDDSRDQSHSRPDQSQYSRFDQHHALDLIFKRSQEAQDTDFPLAIIQAGSGACYAMVPLIRKDLTGKMAGMAGAYGNVGAVFFLTVHSFVSDQEFFRLIGGYAIVVCLSLLFLKSFKNLHTSYR